MKCTKLQKIPKKKTLLLTTSKFIVIQRKMLITFLIFCNWVEVKYFVFNCIPSFKAAFLY